MTLPYPDPTTREQARANAVYYTGRSLEADPGFLGYARVWAMIADTFPYDSETVDPTCNEEGHDHSTSSCLGYVVDKSLPEGHAVVGMENYGADETVVVEDPTTAIMPVIGSVAHVIPSGRNPGLSGRIEVNSLVWDVLRVLASRYVRSSLNRRVSIGMTGDDLTTEDYNLTLRMDSSTVIAEPSKS